MVGWHLNRKTLEVRPVAKIVSRDERMIVLFYEETKSHHFVFTQPESIKRADFFGAIIFVLEEVESPVHWYVDRKNLSVRPVYQKGLVRQRGTTKYSFSEGVPSVLQDDFLFDSFVLAYYKLQNIVMNLE
ncbi:hypothetical protein HQ571_06010 [Candidatus Kuenenbacteria bacterium]|nr:hypothetical protein [Candidatus Kuenenbacteria bacterium]